MPPRKTGLVVKSHKVTDLQVEIGIEQAKELLGWREPRDKDEGKPVSFPGPEGTEKVVFGNNATNRPFSIGLAKRYGEIMLRQEWAGQKGSPSKTSNGEPFILDKKGKIVSCAHRCAGLVFAEYKRQKLVNMGKEEELKVIGADPKKPVVIPAIIITDVDNAGADTVDLGRNRNLGDVLFRRNEIDNKEIPDSVKSRLSKELATAVRLVWLRTQGSQVKGGPKLAIPEAVEFLEEHPLLHEAIYHIYQEDGGSGAEGRKVSNYISLGYAAGLMYLMAFNKSDLQTGVDFKQKPDGWEQAAEFWTLFGQDLHEKDNPIRALHKVLENNRMSEEKMNRDSLCTVVVRSWLAWTEQVDKWKNARSLVSKLYEKSKDNDREVLNLERIGGIDLDRVTLAEYGVTEPDLEERKQVDDWKIGETVWVDQQDGVEPWLGRIEAFSNDGRNAVMKEIGTEEEYAVEVSMLCGDKPMAEEEESVTEE